MFRGVHTAIVTPFVSNRVDLDTLGRLVERQIAAGIDGVVACGTTGEAATLTDAEKLAIFRHVVEVAAGRCAVIAGTGDNNTAHSIALTRETAGCGVDGALVITPYYNKPTQEGLFHHFRAVAEAVPELPIIAYNVPGRTSVSLTADTADRLGDLANVVALKEATADLALDGEMIRRCGDRLALTSGDDATAFPLWCLGGAGVISVCGNLVPDRMVALWRAFQSGDLAGARALHLRLLPLFTGLFIETNPAPVKTLTARVVPGMSAALRLPLAPLTPSSEARLHTLCAALEIPLS